MTLASLARSLAICCMAATAAGAAENPRFHPLDRYTIVYALEGMQTGTFTEHSRSFGYLRAEYERTVVLVGGRRIETNTQAIIEGPIVTRFDLATRAGTRIQNPMYDKLAKAVDGEDAMALSRRMLAALGAKETGESAEYAGEVCRLWRVEMAKQTLCVTDDGLTLLSDVAMPGAAMKRVATEIRRGDGGPDDAFTVPADVKITEIQMRRR